LDRTNLEETLDLDSSSRNIFTLKPTGINGYSGHGEKKLEETIDEIVNEYESINTSSFQK
jgi:hypothetical protein